MISAYSLSLWAIIGLTGKKLYHAVLKSAYKLTAHADIFRFTFKKWLCHCLFPGSSKHNILLCKKKIVRWLSFSSEIKMSPSVPQSF